MSSKLFLQIAGRLPGQGSAKSDVFSLKFRRAGRGDCVQLNIQHVIVGGEMKKPQSADDSSAVDRPLISIISII